MRTSLAFGLLNLSVIVAAACISEDDVKYNRLPNPLELFRPGQSTSQCDMLGDVPFGIVPQGCADLEILYARGTGEPGNLGMVVGDPVVARVQRDLPNVIVHGYPVQYAAKLVGGAPFSKEGFEDVLDRLKHQSRSCPQTKFALVGYSQGGVVMQWILKDIPTDIDPKIVAVVLYGATDGWFVDKKYKQRALANCAPKDFACPDSNLGIEGHVSYNNEGTVWHDRTAEFIEAGFFGRGYGFKLMRSPTKPLEG